MEKLTTILSSLFALLFCFSGEAQSLQYKPGYKFKEGLYLHVQDFKRQEAIGKSQIETSISRQDFQFFEKLFKQKNITFYDKLGNRNTRAISDFWGFSQNGNLFIRINEDFYRVPVFGAISHFIAQKTEYTPPSYSPYYGTYSYYDAGTERTVNQEYIFDFESGRIVEYSPLATEKIFARDSLLFAEYKNLSRRKRRKKMFLYILKYNKHNPVYFHQK